MLWLHYLFFGLMLALGAAAFVLYLRAKEPRAWIWFVAAIVGAAGLAGLIAGRTDGQWRSLAMAAMFLLFAIDHSVQYLQSRGRGAPKPIQLYLGLAWLLMGVIQMIDIN
jgi:hypothetical protein